MASWNRLRSDFGRNNRRGIIVEHAGGFRPSGSNADYDNIFFYGHSAAGQDSQQLKAELDAGRPRMKTLDSELDPILSQMKQLKSEIDQLDSELKALDSEKASGTDVDTADYNARVNRYNDLVSRRKILYTEHSESIEEYQGLAKKDDDLVARYNASLK